MALLNAEKFGHRSAVPVIHAASGAPAAVLATASRGATARLIIKNEYLLATARNIVITIRGQHRSSPGMVMMTPRSSWWQSTAERDGRFACWLESLRALIAAPPVCDVVFTANSGHELGHLGRGEFMGRRSGWTVAPPESATRVHFGANIGAVGGALSLHCRPVPTYAKQPRKNCAALDNRSDAVAPKTLVLSGETRDIHHAGG